MAVNPFYAELSLLRDEYVAKVKPFAPRWNGRAYRSLGKYPALPDDAPVEVGNALGAVQVIDMMITLVGGKRDTYTLSSNQLWKLLWAHETLQAIVLGEGMFGPLLKAGVTRSLQLKKAANTTNEAHVELQAQYQAEVDRLVASGDSYTRACLQVASDRGLKSDRTIRNHTVNRSPRNRGRWVGNR